VGAATLGDRLMESNWFLERFIFWVPLVLSLSVHEWAHAASAKLLGDDTAERLGRMTLNPLEHIDPVGTLILPLLGVPFGWAKPVPVNPLRFRADVGMGKGLMLTAIAGPASNLVLALLVAGIVGIPSYFSRGLVPNAIMPVVSTFIVLNVLLAFFNLLPIPPLDGSRVVDSLIPDSLRPAWDTFAQYSAFALVALIFLPQLGGLNLFAWPQAWAMQLVKMVSQTASIITH
jgi:Zn-dependent protease